MTHDNFLFHRPLVSDTQTDRQTDRQDKYIIDIYIFIYIYFKFEEKTEKSVCLPCKILYCMRIFHNTQIWVTVFNNRLPGELSNLRKSGTLV